VQYITQIQQLGRAVTVLVVVIVKAPAKSATNASISTTAFIFRNTLTCSHLLDS
jgi:hypothetical protein